MSSSGRSPLPTVSERDAEQVGSRGGAAREKGGKKGSERALSPFSECGGGSGAPREGTGVAEGFGGVVVRSVRGKERLRALVSLVGEKGGLSGGRGAKGGSGVD